ncbi:protein-tyrosine phosphatase-like protein [Pestalotiopsis sp. NC0098]|nr:protein-tyrosine phosphatase-like protein [Pestalotiopsis sp. NC0098]
MGWLDRIPRAGNLYIGGQRALFQTDLVQEAGITHVVSVIDYDVDARQLAKMRQLHIDAEDVPSENLLRHFDEAVKFIDDALNGGGAVFVHCAMGKSRSATIVCAYLMWKYRLSASQALARVCEGRPVCQPNDGFMEQLSIYYPIIREDDAQIRDAIVKKWEEKRFRGKAWEWDARKRKL